MKSLISKFSVLFVLTISLYTFSTVNSRNSDDTILSCKFSYKKNDPKTLNDLNCTFPKQWMDRINNEFEEMDMETPVIMESGNRGAELKKNFIKGPADLAIYYIHSPGVSCGGMNTGTCSKSCGALGYPVYWCYPKVCYCHYGTEEDSISNEIDELTVNDA